MKNAIAIILLLSCGCNSSTKTQKGTSKSNNKEYSTTSNKNVMDTLSYIQSDILANKRKYVNQELSVLLNDLKIPVKSYIYGATFFDIRISPGITLSFDDTGESTIKRINHKYSAFLVITWTNPLPNDSINRIRTKSKGAWLDEEKNYFGNKVIKDLSIITDNYIDKRSLPGVFPKRD